MYEQGSGGGSKVPWHCGTPCGLISNRECKVEEM